MFKMKELMKLAKEWEEKYKNIKEITDLPENFIYQMYIDKYGVDKIENINLLNELYAIVKFSDGAMRHIKAEVLNSELPTIKLKETFPLSAEKAASPLIYNTYFIFDKPEIDFIYYRTIGNYGDVKACNCSFSLINPPKLDAETTIALYNEIT